MMRIVALNVRAGGGKKSRCSAELPWPACPQTPHRWRRTRRQHRPLRQRTRQAIKPYLEIVMCSNCFRLFKAEFRPLLWRDAAGKLHNRVHLSAEGMRFRDRNWPVFQRPRRSAERRRPCDVMWDSCGRKQERSIKLSGRLVEARRWWPVSTLDAHRWRVEDAVLRNWNRR
jgi:hypothetical protein